jgi:hypothetical protein
VVSASWTVRARLLRGLGLLLAGLTAGCLVDPDKPCGKHQTYDGERCLCSDGYGLVGTHCVACGENEVGSLDGCTCAMGYLRTAPEEPCEAQDALGIPCKEDADCVHPEYNHCQSGDGEGYCTKRDCTNSSECPTAADYACNTRMSPSFCERPPTGLGTACENDAQCSGLEASYCEAVSSHLCLVSNCKDDPDVCYGDFVCCDIAILGASICIPPGELEGGMCPAGGTLVQSGS